MFAPALGRNPANGSFDDFQKRLLHTLAGNIPGNRDVVGLGRNLVDLVDVDDAALCKLDVAFGVLQQIAHQILDILADIAGLRKHGRIANGEGHSEHLRKRLGQKRLAGACRSDKQDVGLLNLNIGKLAAAFFADRLKSAIVVVHRHGKHFLDFVVANDMLVEKRLDFLGRRRRRKLGSLCFGLPMERNHVIGVTHAIDTNRRSVRRRNHRNIFGTASAE